MTSTAEATWLSEIQAQPQALRDTLAEFQRWEKEADKSFLAKLKEKKDKLRFVFTGMGSSFFNSLPSVQFLHKHGVQVEAKETSEWLAAYQTGAPSNAGWAKRAGEAKAADSHETCIVVAVSQSGESGELCELIKLWTSEAASAGHSGPLPLLWAITNTPQSTLAKAASHVFLTKAGVELTVACKTYVATVLTQHLVSRLIASTVGNLTEAPVTDTIKAQVLDAAKQMEEQLKSGGEFEQGVKQLIPFLAPEGKSDSKDAWQKPPHLEFVGSLTSLSTVYQACLNVKEVLKSTSEALSVGQFRHGPIEMIDKEFRGFLIAHDPATHAWAMKLVQDVTGRWGGGKVVVLSNQSLDSASKKLETDSSSRALFFSIPVANPYLAPAFDIVIIQLLLLRLAELRGLEPGKFRNTAKVTK